MTIQITTLDNLITVMTDTMPAVESATIGVWVGSGARHEELQEHGLAHLLEHMAFKGTTTRNAQQIAEAVERVGGDMNAMTGMEMTAYYVRVLKNDMPLALDILSDILLNSTFSPDELLREQNVIVQEIGAAFDTPDDYVFDLLQEACFGSTALGRSILGTENSVRAQTPDSLRAYLKRRYCGAKMVIAAAGAVSHDAVVAAARERFSAFVGAAPLATAASHFTGGERRDERDIEQANLVLALEGCSFHDALLYPTQAFLNVLGDGMSSRLFQEVREKRGLCYSVYSFHSAYSDTGVGALFASTDAASVPTLLETMLHELKRLPHDMTEAELQRAKVQMKAGLLMGLESSYTRANLRARHILTYGRVLTTEEMVGKIDALTLEAVRDAGQALIYRSPLALSAVGPVSHVPSLASLQAQLQAPLAAE